MTVLAIAQACAQRLMLPVPATFIGSTSNNMILLKAMINQALDEVQDDFAWPELQKEYLFDLATDTASYALPADYDYKLNETLWNRDQHWPLIGPVDAVMWQNYKSGLITTLPRQRFRVKGWENKQFYIDPTPTSDDNGQECVYEYCSTISRRPKTWTASTSWAGFQYCSYNGYIFNRGSTGAATTGTSAPTPSSLNDGLITWTLQETYPDFVYDSDEVILNNQFIVDGAVWRFKCERGLDYADLRARAEEQLEIAKTKLQGGGVLSVNTYSRLPPYLGPWSYPDGNFNQ
jgi:hypothetical protein